MKEHFVFPAEIGQPTGAENIKVTPRFTAETVEGRPKLTGIYHIATTVNVTGKKVEAYEVGEATVIDDLDLNENKGYFEYALPFNIDFPPEAENPVNLKTLNPSHEINKNQLAIVWEVACTYEEAGIQEQKKEAENKQNEEASEENLTAQETAQQEIQEEVAQKEEQKEEKQEKQQATSKSAEVVVATSATTQNDEVLDFIAELEDGISATSFKLNDIFV